MERADIATVRRALADCEGIWPKELSSGVMFYNGRRVLIEDFQEQARLFGYK